jgi:hypothetical protein
MYVFEWETVSGSRWRSHDHSLKVESCAPVTNMLPAALNCTATTRDSPCGAGTLVCMRSACCFLDHRDHILSVCGSPSSPPIHYEVLTTYCPRGSTATL